MEHERESHKALRLIIFCLYLLPILAFGEDAITIFLYATKQLDDVALLSLILAFVGVSRATVCSGHRSDICLGTALSRLPVLPRPTCTKTSPCRPLSSTEIVPPFTMQRYSTDRDAGVDRSLCNRFNCSSSAARMSAREFES